MPKGIESFLSFPLVPFAAFGLVHGHVGHACRNSLLLMIAVKCDT